MQYAGYKLSVIIPSNNTSTDRQGASDMLPLAGKVVIY